MSTHYRGVVFKTIHHRGNFPEAPDLHLTDSWIKQGPEKDCVPQEFLVYSSG